MQEILETKHSTSSILYMIILQWNHLLFTSIPLGNQITCQASFINRTQSRWAIARGKQENKFIYIISSLRIEIVFYLYGEELSELDRGRKGGNYSKRLRKTQKTFSISLIQQKYINLYQTCWKLHCGYWGNIHTDLLTRYFASNANTKLDVHTVLLALILYLISYLAVDSD